MSTASEAPRKPKKTEISDLAILGGTPAFETALHVGRPNIGDRGLLFKYIENIIDNRWLTNSGPYVREFEQRLAQLLKVKHCIAMCNATIALEIAIRALGMTGEVIIPSFTFVATAHALQWQEITPVFVDIDPETHTLDPDAVLKAITPRTTGIIGVHLWGRTCDIQRLEQIARDQELKLLFDAAHAFHCTYRGRMVGNFGNAEVFSFHATKFFNTLEGGAVATNDDGLAKKIRLMKNFGFANYDEVIYIGINGKMNEISAAMGLTSLESMHEFIEINRHNYEHYHQQLAGVAGITFHHYPEREKSNYQYIVLRVVEQQAGLSRDQLMHLLHAENVLARRYFYPGCHRMEPYKTLYPNAHSRLPETKRIAAQVLTLPTGQAVTRETIREICSIIKFAVSNANEIRSRLEGRTGLQ